MKYLVPFLLFLSGCANVSTTKFIYHDPTGITVTVEMPKELEAKNLKVDINAKDGKASIQADTVKTLNAATIKAQSERESKITGAISEGAVKGAVKGLVP